MTLLSTWFIVGIYMDGWAHNHIPELETFFTPWHGVLYSGYLVTAAFLLFLAFRGGNANYIWYKHLPSAYHPSLFGAVIFLLGGVGDLIWHEVFGIEKSVEALLSPTHLVLAIGAGLMFIGNLRAFWQTSFTAKPRLIEALPAILSLTYVFSVVTFMTQFLHPALAIPAGIAPATNIIDTKQSLGIATILFHAAWIVSLVLVAYRQKRLPFGTLTILFGLNALGMGIMKDTQYLIIPALIAGLVGDYLIQRLPWESGRGMMIRWGMALLPMAYYLCYFLGLMLTKQIWWSVHLWTGSIVMAGIEGLLLSYLVLPPSTPAKETV